jgi:hypothetical protein
MEYTLKAVGLHNADAAGNSDKAQPDWDKFASTVEPSFDTDSSTAIREAWDYILGQPPKKQVIRLE